MRLTDSYSIRLLDCDAQKPRQWPTVVQSEIVGWNRPLVYWCGPCFCSQGWCRLPTPERNIIRLPPCLWMNNNLSCFYWTLFSLEKNLALDTSLVQLASNHKHFVYVNTLWNCPLWTVLVAPCRPSLSMFSVSRPFSRPSDEALGVTEQLMRTTFSSSVVCTLAHTSHESPFPGFAWNPSRHSEPWNNGCFLARLSWSCRPIAHWSPFYLLACQLASRLNFRWANSLRIAVRLCQSVVSLDSSFACVWVCLCQATESASKIVELTLKTHRQCFALTTYNYRLITLEDESVALRLRPSDIHQVHIVAWDNQTVVKFDHSVNALDISN